jgi:hypothetical protein
MFSAGHTLEMCSTLAGVKSPFFVLLRVTSDLSSPPFPQLLIKHMYVQCKQAQSKGQGVLVLVLVILRQWPNWYLH